MYILIQSKFEFMFDQILNLVKEHLANNPQVASAIPADQADEVHREIATHVLYIDGNSPNGQVKDSLWALYNKIDPDYRAGDLVLNVNISTPSGSKAKVATQTSNLNIRKGPGTDQPVVGKAAHNELVTLLSKANNQWSLIKTEKGEEGYVYNQYLQPA
jgi:uncharacterized protein YgiM (DUF1202 family)